jgi:purine-nucleoside phosphorylase
VRVKTNENNFIAMDKPINYVAAIELAAQFIKSKYELPLTTGIILGTGLGSLVDKMTITTTIAYEDIPHFPLATVAGHRGRLVIGTLAGKTVLVMQGRFHYYEGYSMKQVVFPVYVMKKLGIDKLLISNAAGGLNPNFGRGDLMLIEDHINCLPENPLRGEDLPALGARFPDMTAAYCPALLQQAKVIAQEQQWNLKSGVYVSVPGPMLETKAEYRLLRNFGADAVGMSTVPEVIAAHHAKIKVFAVSVITDLCYEPHIQEATLEDFIAVAAQATPQLQKLFEKMLSSCRF